MNKQLIMGIDGGGTYTRVLVTDLEGNLVSHVKHQGGASFHKNKNAINDVQNAIKETKVCLEDVCCVVCGIAGYDKEADLVWVNELTNLEELKTIKLNYNDGVIAHAGALLGKEGIIAIAGTGSIVLGLNEEGHYIRNYDFKHNANAASRLLSYNFTHRVLAKETNESDQDVVEKLLQHFHVSSLKELSKIGSHAFNLDTQARDLHFGNFTKNITEAALQGSQLSQKICEETAFNIATGIQLVASTFEAVQIPYALIGSVANSSYIKEHIQKYLPSSFRYIQKPMLPEVGAIILGMKALKITVGENIILNLSKTNIAIS